MGVAFFYGVKVKSEPLFVDVKEVAFGFLSRLVVNADGTLNVQGVMAKEGAARRGRHCARGTLLPASPCRPDARAEEEGREEGTGANPRPLRRLADGAGAVTKLIKIDKVTLQGGTVNLSTASSSPT